MDERGHMHDASLLLHQQTVLRMQQPSHAGCDRLPLGEKKLGTVSAH